MSSWLGNLLRQRSKGHSRRSSEVILGQALRLTAAHTMNLYKAHSSLEVLRETQEVGISPSTDEVTEDVEQLLLLEEHEALVDERLGARRLPVGLRTRRRKARAPGSSTFLFSMAVCSYALDSCAWWS